MPTQKSGRRPSCQQIPIPKTRDPFVNTPLLRLRRSQGGEAFWISTWNSNSGCLAVCIDANGAYKIHHFHRRYPGFYSAAQESARILWLCGNLSWIARFDLHTGKIQHFDTGAPSALVFQGMIFDPHTRKLLVAAYPQSQAPTAVSFDVKRRRTCRIHNNFASDCYMRCSFANGDGTYSFVMQTPGETVACWDPNRETVATTRLSDTRDLHDAAAHGSTMRVICDVSGRAYIPHRGWFDPRHRRIQRRGPRPEREMTWFHRRGNLAFGASHDGETSCCRVGVWDLRKGHVQHLATVPDATVHSLNVTEAGQLVCVDLYGTFRRYSLENGTLELSRRLPTDAVGHVDCLCRIDAHRLLGTPFITQRFWEANLKTGKGFDCGRAAPGAGEILQTWRVGREVYMAAYAGGELVAYDSSHHPHFPENPRVVAKAPHGMRPTAAADDGRRIFYACSAPYGMLGSTLTCYDTKTGDTRHAINPIRDQKICSLWLEKGNDTLLCSSSFEADCASAPPRSSLCYFARIAVTNLRVTNRLRAPRGTTRPVILGPLGHGQWLCQLLGRFPPPGSLLGVLQATAWEPLDTHALPPLPDKCQQIIYASRAGLFVLRFPDRVELWDMRTCTKIDTLHRGRHVYRLMVQKRSVYLVRPRDILVLDDILP